MVGAMNSGFMHGIQTTMSEFAIRKEDEKEWNNGLELLGRPQSVRLTSFARQQFLDIYYQ